MQNIIGIPHFPTQMPVFQNGPLTRRKDFNKWRTRLHYAVVKTVKFSFTVHSLKSEPCDEQLSLTSSLSNVFFQNGAYCCLVSL